MNFTSAFTQTVAEGGRGSQDATKERTNARHRRHFPFSKLIFRKLWSLSEITAPETENQ